MEKRRSAQVTLTCPTHHDKLVNGLWNFFKSGHGTDLNFLDGRRAHRIVAEVFLSSEKLAKLDDQYDASDDTGSDSDLDIKQLCFLLEFLYKGTVTVGEEDLEQLLATARELEFTMLAEAVVAASTPKKRGRGRPPGKTNSRVAVTVPQPAVDTRSTRRAVRERTSSLKTEVDSGVKLDTNDHVVLSAEQLSKLSDKEEQLLRVIEEKKFQCGVCKQLFEYKRTLALHARSHSAGAVHLTVNDDGQDEPVAEVAGAEDPASPSVSTNPKLKRQMRHPPDGSRRFKCDLCPKVFTRRGSVKMHRRIHTGENLFKCETCGKGYPQRHSLILHERTHTGERPFECKEKNCGKRFPIVYQLISHMRNHTGETPYKCDTCGAVFMQLQSLRLHSQSHGDPKPFKCEECGKGFSQRKNLKIHSRIHTGERPFQCTVCGRSFKQSSTLAGHLRTHSGEKPYMCDVCGRSFTQKPVLVRHALTHSDETPFKCEVCFRGFSHVQSLRDHIRTHTGEKPFACTSCPMRFSRRHHLANHSRKHHRL